MKKMLAMILTGVGLLASNAAFLGCSFLIFDEPEMSKSMIER